MGLMLILLILTVLAGLWSVMTAALLRAAIGLALTSILLTIIMFQLGAPLAGVFELSVCAGLISVIFVSVISLTHRLSIQEYLRRRQSRLLRFRYLPVLLVAASMFFVLVYQPFAIPLPAPEKIGDVRVVLWNLRRFDLLGQIIVLLAGVFGVLTLFKGTKNGH